MVGASEVLTRLTEPGRKPRAKRASSNIFIGQIMAHGALPGSGLRRKVPIAPSLAPQPKG